MYSIDLIEVSLATGNQEEFLNGIMFRKFKKTIGGVNEIFNLDAPNRYNISETVKNITALQYFKDTYQIQEINGPSLYERLKNATTIEEHLGTYYQEDEDVSVDGAVPEANKTKKRIITYIVN